MSKILIFILFCAFSLISFAQQETNDIYVYRNDGKFNAFHREEVDSMRYSKFDLDSIEHEDFVIQEFWTNDSIYRLPLSVIDSISINKPHNEYLDNVIKLDEEYISYIKEVDGLTITFEKLPSFLIPSSNSVLLFEDFSDIFPEGFAGKVQEVIVDDEFCKCVCDTVTLEDVYSKIIIFEDYKLVQTETPEKIKTYKLSKYKNDIIGGKIDLEFILSKGPFEFKGSASAEWTVKVILEMQPGKSFYFELGLEDEEKINCSFSCTGEVKSLKIDGKDIFKTSVRIPNYPMLKLNFKTLPFSEISLETKTDIKTEVVTKGYTGIVFENGKFYTKSKKRENNVNIENNLNLSGSLWGGLATSYGISSIGDFISCDLKTYFGPKLNGNINLEVLSTIEEMSWYQALKDCKLSWGCRFEAGMSFSTKLNKKKEWSYPFLKIIPGFEIIFGKRYLLPEFSDLRYNIKDKSVELSTNVDRPVVFPCDVGLKLVDFENRNIHIEYFPYINNHIKTLTPNINLTGNYTIIPMVKLLGMEFHAVPRKSFNMQAVVKTGNVSNIDINSANIWGGYFISIDGNDFVKADSFGFCYSSTNKSPFPENSQTIIAEDDGENLFSSQLTGLQEGTTYYVRAYILVDDIYYYGDVICFTTKEKENQDPQDPSYDYMKPPIAITGESYNIQKNSATIICSYDNISPSTDCGYYIEPEAKGNIDSKIVSLGCVSGRKTIFLSGLMPATTYYYQAYAINEKGKSLGGEHSFTTLKEPEPIVKTGGVSEITQKSAIISCSYDNIPENGKGGVEITSDGWSYSFLISNNDGEYKMNLTNLLPNTIYKYCAYVETKENTYIGEDKFFTTLPPDLTGWWNFSDAQGGNRLHRVEFYSDGTTNNFFGINRLLWSVDGKNILIIWRISSSESAWWEYRGSFNDDFTQATGDAFYCMLNTVTGAYKEIKSEFQFSLYR